MEFTKKGYIAQIAAHLKQKDYEKAYNLAKELVDKFPGEVATHFILSQAAFWLGKYDESAKEGRIAFNKSTSYDDMLTCTILTVSAYLESGKVKEGKEMLNFMENRKSSEEIEKLQFIFSLAAKNEKEAVKHLNDLYEMNHKAAEELVLKYLKE